jgi:hypothetical protein
VRGHSAAVIVQSFRRQNTVAAGYSAINKHDIVLMGSLLVSVSIGDWVSFSPVRGADSLRDPGQPRPPGGDPDQIRGGLC